ncbi:MAG: response regulator [Nitrospirae bacterium]|nr:response regulator [Nitrospirota bacterium]
MENKTRILIVDDEELICWSLKKSFEQNIGYSVNCAYTGDDALRNLVENKYDIIITDLKLPGVNGVELIGKIRRLIKDTPVIVISAYFSETIMNDMSEYDVYRCVSKPFEISDIISGVKEAMAGRVKGISDLGRQDI